MRPLDTADYNLLFDAHINDIVQTSGNWLRRYWQHNVKKHFNLSDTKWSADKHYKTFLAHRGGMEDQKLSNALVFTWNPRVNAVNLCSKPIMVPMREGRGDLISMLVRGTHVSQGAYVARLNARVPWGRRSATDGDAWLAWWSEFIPVLDQRIHNDMGWRLAERIADRIVDDFRHDWPVEEF